MEKSTFIETFVKMPEKIQNQILDYVNSILKEDSKVSGKNFKFKWEGALKDMKETSVELQHKANEWR